MNKPVTKEDIARINAFQRYLVPIAQFKEQRNITKELDSAIALEPERLSLKEDLGAPDHDL